MLQTIVIPGVTVFPRLSWRWESETDILSGSYRTAEQVIASWQKQGLEPLCVEGVDCQRQLFFRPAVG